MNADFGVFAGSPVSSQPIVPYQMQIYWYAATASMSGLVGGGLPAVTAIFDAGSRDVALVQGRRTQESASDVDFRLQCINGSAGLYVENVGSEPRMFIADFESGATMNQTTAWDGDVIDLADVDIIDNAGLNIGNIIPYSNNKFIVSTCVVDYYGATVGTVAKIITFSGTALLSVVSVSVDLTSYPELVRVLDPGEESERTDVYSFFGTSFISASADLCINIPVIVNPFYYSGCIALRCSASSGAVIDYVASAPFGFGAASSLSSLTVLPSAQSTFDSYDKYASAQNFGLQPVSFYVDDDNYEAFEYTSRSLNVVSEYVKDAAFTGVSSVDIDLTALVKAKVASYGFTVVTPSAVSLFDPLFNIGAVAV